MNWINSKLPNILNSLKHYQIDVMDDFKNYNSQTWEREIVLEYPGYFKDDIKFNITIQNKFIKIDGKPLIKWVVKLHNQQDYPEISINLGNTNILPAYTNIEDLNFNHLKNFLKNYDTPTGYASYSDLYVFLGCSDTYYHLNYDVPTRIVNLIKGKIKSIINHQRSIALSRTFPDNIFDKKWFKELVLKNNLTKLNLNI